MNLIKIEMKIKLKSRLVKGVWRLHGAQDGGGIADLDGHRQSLQQVDK